MRILYIVPYMPNPIRVRPFNILRTLAARDHEIILATLVEREEERGDVTVLEAMGVRVLALPLSRQRKARNLLSTLPTRQPLQASYCWQPQLAAAIQRELEDGQYDAVHIEHLRGAAYGLDILRRLPVSARRPVIVWDSVDCISHLFEQAASRSRSTKGRLMARFELGRTRRHEAMLVRAFDHVLVTSPTDKQALERLTANGNQENLPPISIVPNGVDTTYFAPNGPRVDNTIVVTGKMSYHANVSMVMTLVEEIMPRVWAERPDVQLTIVGKEPPAEIARLDPTWSPTRKPPAIGASQAGIVVTGRVDNVPPYLQQATVAVAPVLYGAGIQNKVLEAMACGAPVVASPQAVSALEAESGRVLRIAGDADAFATAIVELLGDREERERLGRAGRAYVEEHHSWTAITEELVSIYASTRRNHAAT